MINLASVVTSTSVKSHNFLCLCSIGLIWDLDDCRCIVVTTTLSEAALATESPSIIRKDIGNITLDDIISGGSSLHSM